MYSPTLSQQHFPFQCSLNVLVLSVPKQKMGPQYKAVFISDTLYVKHCMLAIVKKHLPACTCCCICTILQDIYLLYFVSTRPLTHSIVQENWLIHYEWHVLGWDRRFLNKPPRLALPCLSWYSVWVEHYSNLPTAEHLISVRLPPWHFERLPFGNSPTVQTIYTRT